MTDRFVVLLVIALAGCATFKNTPQQDYVYAMAGPCEGHGAQIKHVHPDGSWTGYASGGAYTVPEFRACMDEQAKTHPYQQWLKENGPKETVGAKP
jgi:hypothetical protein